jgi:tartrate-resistant acid phosphatase type 5
MRKPATIILTLVLFWAGSVFHLHAVQSLHFLLIGDAGSGLEQQKQVAEAMAAYADLNKATNPVNFVLMLGDNFYESGIVGTNDPQWEVKFEKMYNPLRLPLPFFAVLGNHDWRTDPPDAQIDYPKTHPNTRWQMDGHWYKRQFASDSADTNAPPFADFFFLDTQAWNLADPHIKQYADPHLGDKQMAWLEDELKNSRARWKIVVAHHPLYSNGEHGHDPQIKNLRARLGPLFKQYKIDAFITGHDHDLQRIEVPGEPTLFLISGAAGLLRPRYWDDWKPFYASLPGFAAIKLTPNAMQGRFYDVHDKPMDVWTRAPLSSRTEAAHK